MKEQFSKPKGFGEILDHTFRLCKNRFADFFMITLIILGPIYLLQAIVLLFSGTSAIKETGSGETWFEQIASSFDPEADSINLGAELGNSLLGLVLMVLSPVAMAAILFAVHHLRKGEDFTPGKVIKQAFSKFWSIFGSSLLMGMITFGLIFVPVFVIVLLGIFLIVIEPVTGTIFLIVLLLGVGIGVGLLLTRWGFYLGPVVMEGIVPGIGKSWNLTKKRTWKLFGLFIVLFLITGVISYVVEILVGLFLGNSVLFTVIVSVVSLFTSMIVMVGYAVIYFDLTTRHDASDLKEMMADYDNPSRPNNEQ